MLSRRNRTRERGLEMTPLPDKNTQRMIEQYIANRPKSLESFDDSIAHAWLDGFQKGIVRAREIYTT